MVGASLEIMERDTLKMRGERPWVFTNLKERQGLDVVEQFIVRPGCSKRREAAAGRELAREPQPSWRPYAKSNQRFAGGPPGSVARPSGSR